jgi:hypothetical protein
MFRDEEGNILFLLASFWCCKLYSSPIFTPFIHHVIANLYALWPSLTSIELLWLTVAVSIRLIA